MYRPTETDIRREREIDQLIEECADRIQAYTGFGDKDIDRLDLHIERGRGSVRDIRVTGCEVEFVHGQPHFASVEIDPPEIEVD